MRTCDESPITTTARRAEEQRVVRQAVGWGRYDKPRELAIIGELYKRLVVYVDFVQPQMKAPRKDPTRLQRSPPAATLPGRPSSVCSNPVRSHLVERRTLSSRHAQANPAEFKRLIVRLEDDLLEVGRRKVKVQAEAGTKGGEGPTRRLLVAHGFP
jgi:hypothetical protein